MKVSPEILQLVSIPIGYYIGTHIGHFIFKIMHPN